MFGMAPGMCVPLSTGRVGNCQCKPTWGETWLNNGYPALALGTEPEAGHYLAWSINMSRASRLHNNVALLITVLQTSPR